MKAKKYLMQLRKLDVIIRQKEEEIQQLRSNITSISSIDVSDEHVQGGKIVADAHYVNKLIKISELENQAQEERNDYLQKYHDIINQIQDLNNSKYIEILYKHYVEFKRLEVISVEMNYSYQYIVELHGSALREFSEIHKNLLKTYI